MPTNPFDDEVGSFRVLRNDEGQYSLWPEFIDVPAGWFPQYGPDTKVACLAFLEQNWTDMRPNSLVLTMEKEKAPPLFTAALKVMGEPGHCSTSTVGGAKIG
jgi:uncharacterized protein YbdZ (MbtH family)